MLLTQEQAAAIDATLTEAGEIVQAAYNAGSEEVFMCCETSGVKVLISELDPEAFAAAQPDVTLTEVPAAPDQDKPLWCTFLEFATYTDVTDVTVSDALNEATAIVNQNHSN